MTGLTGFSSTCHPSVKRLAALAIGAILAAGAFATAASADDRRDNHRGGYRDHGNRGHNGWSGGYYVAPPVIYGSPYAYQPYYPPPVVYGPSVGIILPGVTIGIR